MNREAFTPFTLSLSVGMITAEPGATGDINDYIQQADKQMYEIKREKKAKRRKGVDVS